MNMLWSFLLRFTEAVCAAAPYVLCGLLLAGICRVLIGRSRLQQLLAGDSLSGPLRGWSLGLLLPVCSLGVLPVARELLRAEVSRRTVFVFLLAAPLFHPLTLAYALSVMDLPLLLFLLAGSLGALLPASQFIQQQPTPSVPDGAEEFFRAESVPYGVRRMAAVGIVAADHLRSPLVWEVLLAFIGVGLVGAFLDASVVGGAFSQESPWAAPLSIGLGTSLYVSPEQSISVLDQMFAHGNSLAAAFALLVCGVGLNLGTLAALRNLFGFRAAFSGLFVIGLSVAVIGSLANSTFYQATITAMDDHAGHEAVGHTHAFDKFARPATLSSNLVSNEVAIRLLREAFQPAATIAVACLALLACGGWLLQRPDVRAKCQTWLTYRSEAETPANIGRPIPGPWIAAASVVGGILGIYFTAIVFFAAPADVFADMRMVRAEALAAVKSDDRAVAGAHFARWEQLAQRLPLGALLRGSANGDQRVSAQLLRQSLGAVQASLAQENDQELDQLLANCERVYQQCQDVFAGQPMVLHSDSEPGMPTKVTDEAEHELYLTAAGLYTETDIAANGNQKASQKYAGFRSAHVMNPPAGSLLCPVTATKANPACTWIVNGREYQFCCPPCIDEFVRTAKESPEEILPPEEYIKR